MPMRQSSLRFERELCAISVWCSETSPGSADSPRVQVDEPAIRLTVRLSGDRHLPRPEDLPPGIDPPRPISVMFVPAKVFDNQALLQVNSEYLAGCHRCHGSSASGCLNGNWKIRPAAGLYFKREWCAVADEVPADLDVVRYWDLAAAEKTGSTTPIGRSASSSAAASAPFSMVR